MANLPADRLLTDRATTAFMEKELPLSSVACYIKKVLATNDCVHAIVLSAISVLDQAMHRIQMKLFICICISNAVLRVPSLLDALKISLLHDVHYKMQRYTYQ